MSEWDNYEPSEHDWLQALKVGDEVAVCEGGVYSGVSISKVTAASAQYIKIDNTRYRRSDGYQPGSGYMRRCLRYPSDEYRARAKRQRLVNYFRSIKTESLTTDQLEQIINIARRK